MYKPPYRIILTRHAYRRALQRGIHSDMIEEVIQQGRMEWFGKNRVKIIKEYHKATIILVDEKIGNEIHIVTIVKKDWV